MNVLVTTDPFGKIDKTPIDLLQNCKQIKQLSFNAIGEKMSKDDLHRMLFENKPDVIIAGTENYSVAELDLVSNLKMISRVGIGVDSINLKECEKRGIIVTNTPNAPSNAVAEMTILQILNMLRKVQNVSEQMMHLNKWNRYIGRELKNCKVGIIGYGRIGSIVCRILQSFGCDILINDIDSNKINQIPRDLENVWKYSKATAIDNIRTLYNSCDIITIHIPLKDDVIDNHNFITVKELDLMKPNVRLLNLSRGGIINEEGLYNWMISHPKATVALDTYVSEPYYGRLNNLRNVYLTPHLASCTVQSRIDMETGATNEFLNYINKKPFQNRVA